LAEIVWIKLQLDLIVMKLGPGRFQEWIRAWSHNRNQIK